MDYDYHRNNDVAASALDYRGLYTPTAPPISDVSVVLAFERGGMAVSLRLFLSDWFSGASTWAGLFKRTMINAVCACGLLVVLVLFSAPADVALAVILSMFVLNGVMTFCFLQQRR